MEMKMMFFTSVVFQELTEEDELSCSPIPSPSGSPIAINQKIKEAESTSDDRTDKPSPVSVLEPLFSDDDISPARIISRTGKHSCFVASL